MKLHLKDVGKIFLDSLWKSSMKGQKSDENQEECELMKVFQKSGKKKHEVIQKKKY